MLAAFCFYNLSSIINGLVYFNQFSLIPPLHLGLVGIGIVILLGGVWAVSIPSEGGVDVGSWGEDEVLDDEESTLEAVEAGKALPLSTRLDETLPELDLSLPNPHKVASDPGIHRVSPPARSPLSRSSISPHSRELTHPTSSARRPAAARGFTVDPDHATVRSRATTHGHGHHPRSPSFSYNQFGAFSPQVGGGSVASTLAAGGLTIGLSPISPGFSLIPKRPRHVSASSNVPQGISISRSETLPVNRLATTSSDALHALGHGRRPLSGTREARRRRTVSEGDVARLANLPSMATASERLQRDEDVHNDAAQEGFGIASPRPDRWGWLRRKFTTRRRS